MGTWGPAIFSDDTAADVRDEFTDLIAEGLSTSKAIKQLLTENADILDDSDDAGVFWLALAATQSKLGRLTARTKNKALKIIDSGADLTRWAESPKSQLTQRKKHLSKLRQQLVSPQPEPKKVRPFKKSTTDFQVGDVFAYRLTDQLSVRFVVYHLAIDKGGIHANISLLELDDGKPFRKKRIKMADTLHVHFFMAGHEPNDRVRILRQNVGVPEHVLDSFRIWNKYEIKCWVRTWKEFPDVLPRELLKLGWITEAEIEPATKQ